MRVLFDTNVVMDALIPDRPGATPVATRLLKAVIDGEIEAAVGATTVTTAWYLLDKKLRSTPNGQERTLRGIALLLRFFPVVAVDHRVLEDALALGWPDFEDAVLFVAGRAFEPDMLVTKDQIGFANADRPVLGPHQLAELLDSQRRTPH